MLHVICYVCFFCFNDTATTEIYTLSLHDALPISWSTRGAGGVRHELAVDLGPAEVRHHHARGELGDLAGHPEDRKSTRLNSSHANISYAVFCLKKKKKSSDTESATTTRTSSYSIL